MSLQELENEAASNPQDAQVIIKLAQAYWAEGGSFREDEKYCLGHLKVAARLDPKNPLVYTLMGDFFRVHEGSTDKAKKCYLKAASLDPDYDVAVDSLYDMYISDKQFTLAESLLAEIAKSPRAKSKALIRLGQLKFARRDYVGAIVDFQSILHSEPLNSKAWSLLADAYLAQGKFEAAIKSFTKAAEITPTSYDLCQVGILNANVFDSSKSLSFFRQGLELTPGDPIYQTQYASSLLKEAQAFYKGGLVHSSLVYLIEAIGILEKSKKSLKLVNTATPHVLLSDAYRMAANFPNELLSSQQLSREICVKRSRAESIRAVHANPVHNALWLKTGERFYEKSPKANEHTLVDRLVRTSIKLNPKCPDSWNLLSFIQTDFRKAQHCILKAISISSHCYAYWNNLGYLALKYGDDEYASRIFLQIQGALENDEKPMIGLALCHIRKGTLDSLQTSLNYLRFASKIPSQSIYAHLLEFHALRAMGQTPEIPELGSFQIMANQSDTQLFSILEALVLEANGLHALSAMAYHRAAQAGALDFEQTLSLARVMSAARDPQAAIQILHKLDKDPAYQKSAAFYKEYIEAIGRISMAV